MRTRQIIYNPIGVIRSEHTAAEKTPIQPVYARECPGKVEVFPEFAEGLQDLDGFSHIYLIYHFHSAPQAVLRIKPFLQDVERGVFATRAPCRPNAIGLSIVELEKIEGQILYVKGMDILDGTPLLDIKPYTAKFDLYDVKKSGWQDEVDETTAQIKGKRDYNS